jgi:predicted glycosyltransferase
MKSITDGNKIWIDIVAPSDVHFFHALLPIFREKYLYISVRDKLENIELAKKYNIKYKKIGVDHPNKYIKYFHIAERTARLYYKIPSFDLSFSFQNMMCSLVTKLRGKTSIMFDDNDFRVFNVNSKAMKLSIAFQKLADFYIIPYACKDSFEKIISNDKIYYYDGYKEDVYISSYIPDRHFNNYLPFNDYIVLRPEALDAIYVKCDSIVPDLIELFSNENINIILLPRFDKKLFLSKYKNYKNIFIPEHAINGLDLCYYSSAVLTGSGTLAREAACMGKLAVSFFPHDNLLSVDNQLVNEGKVFYSRNPKELFEYVVANKNNYLPKTFDRSDQVKNQINNIIIKIIQESN